MKSEISFFNVCDSQNFHSPACWQNNVHVKYFFSIKLFAVSTQKQTHASKKLKPEAQGVYAQVTGHKLNMVPHITGKGKEVD